MKYRAVIFDLFGTLVEIFSRAEYDRMLTEMAAALSIPLSDFTRAWAADGEARTLGKVSSPVDSLVKICRSFGISPTEEQFARACTARLQYYSQTTKLRPEAEEVLTELRAMGCRTGLISNCSTEVHVFWEQTPLSRLIEAAVFSCSAGVKKPDPRIYEIAVERLGVTPGFCLYVADGDSGELQGAIKAGLDAVRFRSPQEEVSDALRVNEEDWKGLTISTLKQVLDLVKDGVPT